MEMVSAHDCELQNKKRQLEGLKYIHAETGRGGLRARKGRKRRVFPKLK
jgi:hypothetical protein